MSAEPSRILLVDDNPLMLDHHAVMLRVAGFSVRAENNRRDAMRALAGYRPHLIASDIRMERMDDGYVLCRQVRSDPDIEDIPIILYSAQDVTTETRNQAQSAGATAILMTLPGIDWLVREIRSVLSLPQ